MASALARIAESLESVPEPIWLWDAHAQRILWANKAALGFWGAASIFDLIDERFDAASARAFSEPGTHAETDVVRGSGRVRARLIVHPISLTSPARGRLVIVVKTSARSTSPATRRAHAFDRSPAALCVADVNGKMIEANGACTTLLGHRPAHLADILGDAESARLVSYALAFGEARLAVKGARGSLRVRAIKSIDPLTDTVIFLIRVEDMTRHRALEGLYEERLKAVREDAARKIAEAGARIALPIPASAQEEAPDPGPSLEDIATQALIALDRDGLILHANTAAERLTGAARAALRGRALADFLPLPIRADVKEYFDTCSPLSARTWSDGRETEILAGPNAPRPIKLVLVPHADGFAAVLEGRKAAPAAAGTNDTDRKNKATSDFVAKLSHEMRNPLNAIIGFSEIMQQQHFGPLGNSRYEGYADDIRNSAGHLLSLVNDLLDMAKVESGRMKLEFESVELAPIVDETLRILAPAAQGYGVHLRADLPQDVPPVVADARSIRQVLINLISNALKFTEPGGEVTVSAARGAEGGVTLKVTDTGIGMNRGELQLAMEPFGQVAGPMQKERQGTGLGLPLAKALAEANEASFQILSEPKMGTEVQISFPSTRVLGS